MYITHTCNGIETKKNTRSSFDDSSDDIEMVYELSEILSFDITSMISLSLSSC